MKNVNYNLIKMLHTTLDDVWRLEKYYVDDAHEAKCESEGPMKTMLDQRKKDIDAILAEIKKRMDAGIFN